MRVARGANRVKDETYNRHPTSIFRTAGDSYGPPREIGRHGFLWLYNLDSLGGSETYLHSRFTIILIKREAPAARPARSTRRSHPDHSKRTYHRSLRHVGFDGVECVVERLAKVSLIEDNKAVLREQTGLV